MVATTLPWPRSLLPLRGAAAAAAVAARGYHRSIESRTFAVAASSSMASSGGEDDAIELARKIRARAPSACWSSDETPAVLAPPPPPANSSSSSSSLPLSGLTFASKEMYDVAGQEPAFGSPAYRRWRQKKASSTSCSTSSYTSTTTAPAVAALVAAGATLVGRTTMSEIAYALTGDHTFYPVPPNPAFEVDDPSSPPRLCGGSSSGSACAVASKSVDFALGSDTGGSVRVPASYCGIFGFRPTHGKVSLEGAQALAPSFDTAGWFAKDAETLRDVGKVLLGGEGEKGEEEKGEKKKSSFDLKRWLVAADAFDKARPEVSKAIFEAVARSKGEIELLLSPPTEVQLWDPEANGSEGAKDAFRFAQAAEVLRPEVLGEFLRSNPELGPVAKERIEWARTVTEEQEAEALKARAALRARLDSILDHDGVIALPAAPDTAPLAGSGADVAPSRGVLLELTAAAGLGGYPQIVLPVAVVAPGTVTGGGGPVGLSFLGPRGSDSELLELGVTVSRAMKL